MDYIASYNSDVTNLKTFIQKKMDELNELTNEDRNKMIKGYKRTNEEMEDLLYRERLLFYLYSFIGVSITLITIKTI